MGVVYQAEDTRLRRTVALKFVTADDPLRFLHEAQAAAALHHPNICTIFEIDQEHGFLAMEYLEGQTLRDKIRERPLRLEEAIDIAAQIGAGLEAAHEKGIVHRDIKSGNIVITPKGQVKIMDFGLAQLAGGTRITRTGAAMGTPAYMAPEQARGEAVDRRVDLWSFGVVLYEMVTGRLPFAGDAEAAVIHSILQTEPEPPTALRSGLPVQLDRVIAKALRKDPHDRYQHVADLLVDLRAAGKSRAQTTGSTRPSSARWAYFAAGAFVGGAIIAVIALTRDGGIANPPPRGDTSALQITSYSGTERWGAISPDGKYFAFVSDKGGRPDIWVRQISGGEPVQVTDDDAAEARLAYSPDGESLYFDAKRAIWRVPSLGGTATKIVDGRIGPSPSPDGKRLACVRPQAVAESGQSLIEVCGTQGTSCRTVHSAPGTTQVSWSPDGKWLAFAAGTLFDERILYVIQPDGKNERRVAPVPGGSVYSQAWLPDSSALVVSGATDIPGPMSDTMDLSIVRLAGGLVRRLTLNVSVRFLNPSVAASGDRLLATSQSFVREVWKVPLGPDAKANGRAAVRIVEASLNPFWTQVVSRQSMLLFNSPATGIRNLWTMSLVPGAMPRQITAFTTNPARHGALSPDLARVAFSSREIGDPAAPQGTKISVMNLDGSDRVALTTGPGLDFWPCWSPDGRSIAFTSDREGSSQIWTVNATGGTPVRLNDGGGYRSDWSPDGTRIAYWARGPSRLEVADARSGKPLMKIPFATSFPVWSPDGHQLAAAEGDAAEGGNAVWIFDVATGRGRKAVEFPPNFHVVFRAGWTADGKALIVNRMDAVSNIVLLERF